MQANDITRDRLRRLAEADVGGAKVLSLFLNLDPREFATPPARSTEIRSLLDRAGRLVREESEQLTHEPDLVLHGHAHAGRFEGAIGNVPVYNVSVPVMERDFWVFEVAGLQRSTAPVH